LIDENLDSPLKSSPDKKKDNLENKKPSQFKIKHNTFVI
jgi:hypothetical protein